MSNNRLRGRFKHALHPLAAQFNASIGFDKVLYAYDIQGSKAHANMLAAQGIISIHEAQAINTALDQIALEIQQGQHAFSEEYEDIHMLIEQLLINKIGDTGKKLHTGRSRNDQVALDLRLYTRDAIEQGIALLNRTITTFHGLASKHAEDVLPGYTHLQQAQPIKLGWYFAAYENMFKRDVARFQALHDSMNYSPLGAGALAGSQLPLDRQFVAHALGFKGYIENTLDAVSDRDFVLEFCSSSAIAMVHLSRLAEDLILWATSEFGFVTLSDQFATGSSLMPNKKNPDILELIRGKSGRVFGDLMAMLTVMKALPLTYNKDMQEDKEALFDSANTLIACLTMIPPFMDSLQFNTTTMAEKARGGFLEATAWVERLVAQGVPFRDAHHQVGTWVGAAVERGCSLAEIIGDGSSTVSSE